MLINLKVKTLDAQTHEISIDNEATVREFKDKVAEKTNIAADQQRIIYCGRVMVDDKHMKDYDVDGKVVHVAERPPPSQRANTSDNANANENSTTNERRGRAGRAAAAGMRNSPLFRALDGMVVGTMAFPMNATNGQPAVNPFAASSSFCMNRITVARHMLDCANNIAAYLEDPTRGINNQPLDILARGRWTMESTVVEVGITSDIPQSQQIVEMVQGAVQAALRRSGNTNVTLVQLPTVFSGNDSNAASRDNASAGVGAGSAESDAANSVNASETIPTVSFAAVADDNSPVQNTAAGAVIIEDVLDDDVDTLTNDANISNTSENNTTVESETGGVGDGAADDGTDDGGDGSRRRTSTRVLAGVIEQMRNVQTRLNPFIEQYYDLLLNEPSFEENDTTGRENTQRLFDRVSEAFHYLSHAQHAISDLMLDVSQDSPRFLTCRPILVEQSGYVSSNNFISPAMLPAALRQQQPQQRSSSATRSRPRVLPSEASVAATLGYIRDNNRSTSTSTSSTDNSTSTVDDPVDEPVVWPPTISFGNASASSNNGATNNNANATGRGATLPTTSTQTRSTARPQVHIGNIPVLGMGAPAWNGRVMPNNNVSSFDRFLPCNSHHIREPDNGNSENATNQQQGTSATGAVNRGNANSVGSTLTNAQRPRRTVPMAASATGATVTGGNTASNMDLLESVVNMVVMASPSSTGNNSRASAAAAAANTAASAPEPSSDIQLDAQRRNLHTQLMSFINDHIFEGKPINEETVPPAINRAVQWFGESLLFLPQYEKPEFDSRDSLINILRSTLPSVIELLKCKPVNLKEFEQNLKKICEQFRMRLYSVLLVCIGQTNADMYWSQLMRLLCVSAQSNFQGSVVEFLGVYLSPNIPNASDTLDAQQFIVYRTITSSSASSSSSSSQVNNAADKSTPMDTDVEMTEVQAGSSQTEEEIIDEPLPHVVPGSAAWHRNFPNEWLPIITRDIQRQQENPSNQAPFSDAYINGMSSKRRKLIQNTKPPTELSSLIADTVTKAIETAGLTSSTASNHTHTASEVAGTIASDASVQSSCTEAIRTNVRERLKKDPDYVAEKYPKSTKFIQK